jgi:dihydrofolate reductase
MRRIRYAVAASLDGYIAGPNGEFDWIIQDPEIDFGALFRQFDTALIGRLTYEAMLRSGNGMLPGMKTFVFSRTLQQRDHPGVTVIWEGSTEAVAALRSAPGKDIWLFGGGSLFRSLAGANLVDTVEVGVIPILLGEGVPLLPPPAMPIKLTLRSQKVYKRTGIVSLVYDVT